MYGHISEYSTYYESLLADIKKQHTPGKLFSKLRKAVTRQSWMSSPVTINAYYTAVMNEIILPLGILQAPFFNSKVKSQEKVWYLFPIASLTYVKSTCLLEIWSAKLWRHWILNWPRAVTCIRWQWKKVQWKRRLGKNSVAFCFHYQFLEQIIGILVVWRNIVQIQRAHRMPGVSVQ